MPPQVPFKQRPLAERCDLYNDLKRQYPERVPVIAERGQKTDLPVMTKRKYLVPQNMTVSGFLSVVQSRLALDASKSLYLFVGKNVLSNAEQRMSEVYELYRDREDGFLYITYRAENTQG